MSRPEIVKIRWTPTAWCQWVEMHEGAAVREWVPLPFTASAPLLVVAADIAGRVPGAVVVVIGEPPAELMN